ncbi:MAG: hypothetical protein SGILL_000881 [Bacillariaceae sp.]
MNDLYHDNNDDEDDDEAIQQYYLVEEWCRQAIAANSGSESNTSDFLFDPTLFHAELKRKSREFQFPFLSLQSFFRSIHVQHIKSKSYKIKSQFASRYLPEYTSGKKTILQIAREAFNFSPYLMARMVVEEVALLDTTTKEGIPKKKLITNAMRNPIGELSSFKKIREEYWDTEREWARQQQQQPEDDDVFTTANTTNTTTTTNITRLATQVKEAVDSDPLSGPLSDRAKHYIGIEYEVALEQMLTDRGE